MLLLVTAALLLAIGLAPLGLALILPPDFGTGLFGAMALLLSLTAAPLGAITLSVAVILLLVALLRHARAGRGAAPGP
jgi:hypothetical protein